MSATNSTANYSLPIFVSSDVPSWLTDWNGAMGDIDTAIAAAKATADSALLASGNNTTDITTIQGQITVLQTTVGTHTTQIGTISGNINTINSLIGNGTPTTTDQTIIGAINELHANQGDLADLTTTDKSSLVAAINEAAQGGGGGTPAASAVSYDNTGSGLTATNVQDAIDELAGSGTVEVLGSVTGDGTKTATQLLDALFAAVADKTKIGYDAVLVQTSSADIKTFKTANSLVDDSEFDFECPNFSIATMYEYIVKMKASGSSYGYFTLGTGAFTDQSSYVIPSGETLTLYAK